MNKIARSLALLVAALALYLCLWPTPVAPVVWTPPTAPSLTEGRYALNDKLKNVERIAPQAGANGPETVTLDAQGKVYTGYLDGRIVRYEPDGSGYQLIANTGGRPLGIALLPDGSLVTADAVKGLLRVGADGTVKVLADQAEGLRFGFPDDVAVDGNGQNAYFTDASSKFRTPHFTEDLLEHGGHGRLLRYNFASGQTTVLLKGLQFANGVSVGPNDDYLLVAETGQYRVQRYWLKGDKAGKAEIFIANLPGFPDNLSFNPGRDRIWLAIAAPRDALLDGAAGGVFLRKLISRLPAALVPKPPRHGFVLALDLDGKVIANLQHAGADAYASINSVREFGSWLYFGSVEQDPIARLPLSTALAR